MSDSEKTKDGPKEVNILDRMVDAVLGVVNPPRTAADFVRLLGTDPGLSRVPYPGAEAVRRLRTASEKPWFTSEQVAELRKLQTAWKNLENAVNQHTDQQARQKADSMISANIARAERGEALRGAVDDQALRDRFIEQRRKFRVRETEIANQARAILEGALVQLNETAQRVADEVESAHAKCFTEWGLSAPACPAATMLRSAAPKLAQNLIRSNLNAFPDVSGWLD